MLQGEWVRENKENMKIYDLFGGIGGFSEAARRVGWNTAGYCELEKTAVAVYNQNFSTNHTPTDVRKLNTGELPDFDILTAGFPCQSFSIAGLRKGFSDERGNLFFEIARILRDKQPKMFLLENVKGLLSSDDGATFRKILDTLRELGYVGQYQVINSKHHGVAQNRERVFILGFRGECPFQIFPLGANGGAVDELQGQTTNTLTARYEGAQATGSYIIENQLNAQRIMQINNPPHIQDRVYSKSGVSPALNTGTGGNLQPKIVVIDAYNSSIVDIPGAVRPNMGNGGPLVMLNSATKDGFSIAEEGDGIRLQFPNSKTARGRVVKGATQALQTSGAGGVIQNQKIRRLTPLECERLQSFSDHWTWHGVMDGKYFEVSDSQRYRLLGNSITVNVAEAIFRRMIAAGVL